MAELPKVLASRPWTCPDCGDTITLSLVSTHPNTQPAVVMVSIDDIDIRAHLAMHEQCTCGWEHLDIHDGLGKAVRHHVARHPADDCPIHEGSNHEQQPPQG